MSKSRSFWKSSDAVVGQILRYIGWLKENPPHGYKDYGVRGIIIARDRDEKIMFALKECPCVSLWLYNVNFSLQRIK